ncbi:uncharacterized protein LOC144157923 [Haemaphysalis longicornis]
MRPDHPSCHKTGLTQITKMFPTPSSVRSNDVGCRTRDQPPSKKQCLDNAAVPEFHERSLVLTTSTSLGENHCIGNPLRPNHQIYGYGADTFFPESTDICKKSGMYEQENFLSSGQETCEDSTAVNRYELVSGKSGLPTGKCKSYGAPDRPYESGHATPREHYETLSLPSGCFATHIGVNRDSGSSSMSVHKGHKISGNHFASSGATNPNSSFQCAPQTRNVGGSSGSERADSCSASSTLKPDQSGGLCDAYSLHNYGGSDIGFPQQSAVYPVLANTWVHNPVGDFASGPRCQSTATDAYSAATVFSHNGPHVSDQGGGSSTMRTVNSSFGYTVTPTFSSGQKIDAPQARKEIKEMCIYSGNCYNSQTNSVVHAEGQSNPAACKPEMTPATFYGYNTLVPVMGVIPYWTFNPNLYFPGKQAKNQVPWTYFANSTSSHSNFFSPLGLDASAWSGNASADKYHYYSSGKLTESESATSATPAVESNWASHSMNPLLAIMNNEAGVVGSDIGKGSHISSMSGYVVADKREEPTVAVASVDGAVYGMPPKSTGVGQLDTTKATAESGSSIVNSNERSLEAGISASDVESTGEIGPQAYPCSYSGMLNSRIRHAADATKRRAKRKLKWPLPIPIYMRPQDTKLTFHDIDYTWVTHDIQVSAQGGVYAQTIDSNGCLQVFVESARTANNLLQLNILAGVPVKISVGRNYTDNVGYIRKVPRRFSDAVLFEFLEDQGLLCAKRQIGYMKNDTGYTGDLTTGTVVLLFMPDRPLPSSVTIDKISYQVTRRLRLPMQCFNCQSFGHEAPSCTSSTRCRFCGGPHVYTECKRRGEPECVNCHERHASTFWRCPVRLAHASTDPRNDWLRDAIKDL